MAARGLYPTIVDASVLASPFTANVHYQAPRIMWIKSLLGHHPPIQNRMQKLFELWKWVGWDCIILVISFFANFWIFYWMKKLNQKLTICILYKIILTNVIQAKELYKINWFVWKGLRFIHSFLVLQFVAVFVPRLRMNELCPASLLFVSWCPAQSVW